MSYRLPNPNEISLVMRNAIQSLKDYVDSRNIRCKVLTTAERDAMTAETGMVIFNSTLSKHQGFDGTAWQNFY